MTRPAPLSTLGFEIDRRVPNYPKVRILIDDVELLNPAGRETGNDPADLFDTDALEPHPIPRRIAFYGCGCGEFGCSCVAGLVSAGDGVVRWSDFRSATGVYTDALPPDDEPDPARCEETFSHRLLLRDVAFDEEHYRSVIAAARADRSWETRSRAVVRLLKALRPDDVLWATSAGDQIEVVQVGGRATHTVLELPPGQPEEMAHALDVLLASHHPGRIAAERLWAVATPKRP